MAASHDESMLPSLAHSMADVRSPLLPSAIDDGLSGTMADFLELPATTFEDRARRYHQWQANRQARGVWQFSNTLLAAPAPVVGVSRENGVSRVGLNYASQDYLSLSNDQRLKTAALRALDQYGLHSAGSPILQGNTPESLGLEEALGKALGYRHVVLFATGWAAGFGTIYGLVRKADHVVLDQYAHNCLAVGAQAATPNVSRVRHLDINAYESRLKKIRRSDAHAAVLVVTEGLFSMDADSPDLAALHVLCRRYGAMLFVDVAHDFGATGPGGLGTLARAGLLGEVDLVMGSFSKTFAANGGFLASNSAAIKQ